MIESRSAPRSATLTIGGLAECSGVSVEAIRYYQRRGLLREPPRPTHGIRHYGTEHADRVHFIKSAQRLGFTLDDVSRMLVLEDGMKCAEARRMAAQHLGDVRQKLSDLRAIERQLQTLVNLCNMQSSENVHCPLIASLQAAGQVAHP